jgi:ribosome maturation factor RimP
MEATGTVQDLVAPALAAEGLEVVDVELAGATLRVTVDRPEGGIDLDAVAEATRVVSDLLDRHDPIPGRYTLEVSSPGLERTLRTPEHFRRFVGTTVSVKTVPGAEGDRRLQGRLDAADDDGVELEGRRIPYAQIERARTVFEWGPGPKPSAKKKAAAR